MSPRDIPCPACYSKAGELCTQPDDFGRHPVKTYHLSRVHDAEERSE